MHASWKTTSALFVLVLAGLAGCAAGADDAASDGETLTASAADEAPGPADPHGTAGSPSVIVNVTQNNGSSHHGGHGWGGHGWGGHGWGGHGGHGGHHGCNALVGPRARACACARSGAVAAAAAAAPLRPRRRLSLPELTEAPARLVLAGASISRHTATAAPRVTPIRGVLPGSRGAGT